MPPLRSTASWLSCSLTVSWSQTVTVEIHYVILTTPACEHVRFSRLRTNYSHRLPRRPFLGQKALRAACAELVEDRVVDRAQRVDAWTPDG